MPYLSSVSPTELTVPVSHLDQYSIQRGRSDAKIGYQVTTLALRINTQGRPGTGKACAHKGSKDEGL